MKVNGFWAAALAILITLGPLTAVSSQAASNTLQTASPEAIGQAVQQALEKANATGLGGLVMKKVVLTLETGGTLDVGGKLNFLIFSVEHTSKKGTTIDQTLTFGSVGKQQGASTGNLETLPDVLSKAVASAALTASKVSELPFSEATIKLTFAVDVKNGGSISYKILGINLGPEVDFEKTSKNTLEVTFAKAGS
jgi:hypothetical protein